MTETFTPIDIFRPSSSLLSSQLFLQQCKEKRILEQYRLILEIGYFEKNKALLSQHKYRRQREHIKHVDTNKLLL